MEIAATTSETLERALHYAALHDDSVTQLKAIARQESRKAENAFKLLGLVLQQTGPVTIDAYPSNSFDPQFSMALEGEKATLKLQS